jgi:hypothetical protein
MAKRRAAKPADRTLFSIKRLWHNEMEGYVFTK